MKVLDGIRVNARFSRSASVERDSGAASIGGYVPTARALDVVDRLARSMSDPTHGGRALSITGPHGGGKSSLALFLAALYGPRASAAFKAAFSALESADSDLAERFDQGLRSLGVGKRGAAQGFVTASTEPVAVTIARAVARAQGLGVVDAVPAAVIDAVRSIVTDQPLVLLVDEFGKNLEAYTRGSGDGDLFLLQTLAEMAQGVEAAPLIVITMQHLAFGEYIQETSAAKRREWAKVQGRFHDVPFVESSGQSRVLIASALEVTDPSLAGAVNVWGKGLRKQLSGLGLHELADGAESVFPIHPVAAAVLPELCSRYGQNERTLFSFLAGSEPRAVPALLEQSVWRQGTSLTAVGLDAVYDYFLDSAATSVSVSAGSSRWLEIESRVRDSRGLTEFERSVLKSIGVLNLVSAGGTLRASRQLLEGLFGAGESLAESLEALVAQSLITYREFADEFRVWSGSDFDVQGALEQARRVVAEWNFADMLNDLSLLQPAVAGRHSQSTGILRVFDQCFMTMDRLDQGRGAASGTDGMVMYMLDGRANDLVRQVAGDDRPCVIAYPGNGQDALESVAREAAAVGYVLGGAMNLPIDWVAERELRERQEMLIQSLRVAASQAWTARGSRWSLLGSPTRLDRRGGLSSLLSTVCDEVYCATPRIPNELITRNQISSQAARARRVVIEAMLANPGEPHFGIEGFGPERTIYDAVFGASGLHRKRSGVWTLGQPSDTAWKSMWAEVTRALESASTKREPVDHLTAQLTTAPYGIKDGLLPLLWTTVLVARAKDLALYEHGSLVLSFDDAVAERLAKNPGNFTFKFLATSAGPRAAFLQELAKALGLADLGEDSLMSVARGIFRELRQVPAYTLGTGRVSSAAAGLRKAVLEAREPDELVFALLPEAVGEAAIPAVGIVNKRALATTARKIAQPLSELRDAYPALLERIGTVVAAATGLAGDLSAMRKQLDAQCTSLAGKVLDPRLQALIFAANRDSGSDADWLENVAMVVAGGKNPRSWTDEQERGFSLPMEELGGALRRTSALLFAQLARDSEAGFEARRVTITSPDGSERVAVVTLGSDAAAVIDEHVPQLLGNMADRLGVSPEEACQTLMAWLAVRDNDTPVAHSGQGVSQQKKRKGAR